MGKLYLDVTYKVDNYSYFNYKLYNEDVIVLINKLITDGRQINFEDIRDKLLEI